jgi:hypothetical protein
MNPLVAPPRVDRGAAGASLAVQAQDVHIKKSQIVNLICAGRIVHLSARADEIRERPCPRDKDV